METGTATVTVAAPGRSPRVAPITRAARRGSTVLLCVPVVAYLVVGWSRRWTVDDAFINYRVVKHVLAGHGPVFNSGDRVEATTSTLWAALLVIADILSPARLEWTALALELVLGAAGLAAGMAGALRLARLRGGGDAMWPTVPVGALAYLGVAATWDWATGGLENGLALLWLGASFLAVVVLGGTSTPSRRRVTATALLAGVGVLVRPDFAVYSVGFCVVVGLAAWRRGGRRGLLAAGATASAIPVAAQVLRMGFYGQLLPNTLYAKEGTSAWWGQGWKYLLNFTLPYLLVIPVVALAVWLVSSWHATGPGGRAVEWRLVVLSVEVAALLHLLAVVRVGGDYMHGRLLHVTWFAALLPVLAVPLERRRAPVRALAVAVILAWAGAAALLWRPPPGMLLNGSADALDVPAVRGAVTGVVDGRSLTVALATNDHPVLAEHNAAHATTLATLSSAGYRPGYYDPGQPPVPGRNPTRIVLTAHGLGVVGYTAPLDALVFDRHGLADVVVSHVRLDWRATPGHEKDIGAPWIAAAFLDPATRIDPATFARMPGLTAALSGVDLPGEIDVEAFEADRAAAAEALGCGELRTLVENTRGRLTVGRFAGNIVDALRLHAFRFPVDPLAARAEVCD